MEAHGAEKLGPGGFFLPLSFNECLLNADPRMNSPSDLGFKTVIFDSVAVDFEMN